MFKNKSPLGKQNIRNDKFINEQIVAYPHSPLKHINKNCEHTFAKVKRAYNHKHDRTATAAPINLQNRHSYNLSLQCDETLEILNNLPISGQRDFDEIGQDLVCDQEIAPITRNSSRYFNRYVERIQILLYDYMRRDMEKNQYIRKLEQQRLIALQNSSRQEQMMREKGVYWK